MLKSLILLFVHLISLCCPVLFQARPIDSLNRTCYNNCQQKIIHSARGICADACISSYIYIYIYIRRILHSSTISVGLAQARPNYIHACASVYTFRHARNEIGQSKEM